MGEVVETATSKQTTGRRLQEAKLLEGCPDVELQEGFAGDSALSIEPDEDDVPDEDMPALAAAAFALFPFPFPAFPFPAFAGSAGTFVLSTT